MSFFQTCTLLLCYVSLPFTLSSCLFFFFSSRRRHTRCLSDWSSDVCSSDLENATAEVRSVVSYLPALLRAAGVTLALSILAMALAIAAGTSVAAGRVYGPWLEIGRASCRERGEVGVGGVVVERRARCTAEGK